jgi:Leucine-rich repeat (LRR) protein
MKILIVFLPVLTLVSISTAQNVDIPDVSFLNILIELGVDTNGDSLISYSECETVKNLDVSQRWVSDLTGIEAFINLDSLNCSSNQLTSLDVSKNIALSFLECSGNQLTSLDVSKNTALRILDCSSNELTLLDVSNNTALVILVCASNQLASLDISQNTALGLLLCSLNQLTSLDVSENTYLGSLFCGSNQLTNLDLSHNINLGKLGCQFNSITNLDLSYNPYLGDLDCSANSISSLDVSNNTALLSLACLQNLLTNLDVSNDTALIQLMCGSNQLTNLDLSHNSELSYLDISSMPSLIGVCVWELPFPPDGTYVFSNNSPNVNFTTDCSTTTLKPHKVNGRIFIYPNPTREYLLFDIENPSSILRVELYDLRGTKVLEKVLLKDNYISVSDLPKGIYLYRLHDSGNVYRGKITVE